KREKSNEEKKKKKKRAREEGAEARERIETDGTEMKIDTGKGGRESFIRRCRYREYKTQQRKKAKVPREERRNWEIQRREREKSREVDSRAYLGCLLSKFEANSLSGIGGSKENLLNRRCRCATCIATKAMPSLRTCQRVAASQRNTAASRRRGNASSSMSFVTCILLPSEYAAFRIPPAIKKHAHVDDRFEVQLHLPSSNSVRTI
ncbi:hypothetical protein ALC62_01058, partial [Cyphomyrmex costatus]